MCPQINYVGAMLMVLMMACPSPKCDADCPDTGPETVDTEDTGEAYTGPAGCETPHATFKPSSGAAVDMTAVMTAGTYTTLDQPGVLEVCPGTWFTRLLIRADVTVKGLDTTPDTTILSGGESGTILDLAGATLTVENITLNRGAGLDVEHNSGGGGIYCEGNGTVLVEDAVFSENFANDGPAIYTQYCSLEVRDTLFIDNLAEDDGGAVALWYSDADIRDTIFQDNEALDGGALALFYGELYVADTSVMNNSSKNFAGGFWTLESDVTVLDSLFEGNVNAPGTQGGGMLINGSASLNRVTFRDNGAPRGGGIFVYWEADVLGTNCSFSGNSPEDIFSADYSPEGGVSHSGSDDFSFFCEKNACSEI